MTTYQKQIVELVASSGDYFIVKITRLDEAGREIQHFGSGSSPMDAEKYAIQIFEKEK